MLRAVGALTLLLVLLCGTSPDATAQSFMGTDTFELSARSQIARDQQKQVLVAPGSRDAQSLDPWQLVGNLPGPRLAMGALVWGDYLYILGGFYDGSSVIRSHFDASGRLGPWQNMYSMWNAKWGFGTAVSGENLYTLGGYDQYHKPLKEVERTIIQADGMLGGWQPASSLSTERPRCSAIAVKNYVYVLGGESSSSSWPINSVERAEIKSDGSLEDWQVMAAMTTARSSPGVVALNGYIYAIGGVGRDTVRAYSLDSVERAFVNPDGSLGPWESTTPLMHPRRAAAAIVSDSYIYAIGGHNGVDDYPSYASVERTLVNSDGSLDGWQFADAMVVPRASHAAVMWNGHLYAIGGENPPADLLTIEGTVGPAAFFLPFVTN